MYDYFKGELASIASNYVVIEVGGIGYCVHMANPFALQTELKKRVTLYIYQAVREDAITLYGFASQTEKSIFLQLIGVSGIGPKSALAILANGDHEGLVQAIVGGNVSYLTKFPGVGKKTAGQIILDLKDKVSLPEGLDQGLASDLGQVASQGTSGTGNNPVLDQVQDALLGLGYSAKEIAKIMPTLQEDDWSDSSAALKKAFNLLLGKK